MSPLRPITMTVPDWDHGYIALHWFTATTTDYPATSVAVFRSVGGSDNWERLAENLPLAGCWMDYTAPLAGKVDYVVVAEDSAGPSYAMSVAEQLDLSPDHCAEYIYLSGGPGFATVGKFRGSPSISTDDARNDVFAQALNDDDPYFWPGAMKTRTLSFSGVIEENDPMSTEAVLSAIAEWDGSVLYRDAHGRQVFGSLDALSFTQKSRKPFSTQDFSSKLVDTYLTGLVAFRWTTDTPLPPPLTSLQIIAILNQWPSSGAWGSVFGGIPKFPEFGSWINPYAFNMTNGSQIGMNPGTFVWGPYDPSLYNSDPYAPATVMGTSTSPTSCIDGTSNLPKPGDTFYMPVPAFYPGEANNWGTVIDAGANYPDLSTADGTTFYTPTAGQQMVTGGGLDLAGYFTPTPILDKAHWAIRVRGTGTFTIQTGYESDGGSSWYSNGASAISNWSGITTINIASGSWIDRAVPIPSADLAGASNMYTFCNLIQVTSGSLDFDFIQFRAAGDCGYCVLTGVTSYGPWHSIAPATVRLYADYVDVTAQFNQADAAATDFGTATSPTAAQGTFDPVVDADVNLLYGVPASTSGADSFNPPTDGSAYGQSTGRGYPELSASISKPQWWFSPYYAGAGGIPPHNATAGWGTDATVDSTDPALRTMRQARYIKFNPAYISKPATPPEVVSGMIQNINYDNVYYDTTTQTSLIKWIVSGATAGGGKGFDGNNQSPVENDFYMEARLNTTWAPGQPLPAAGDGTVIATATGHGGAGVASTPSDTAVAGGDLTTSPNFSIWVQTTSGECTFASYSADLQMQVQYPQAHARLLQWEYLGG